MEAKQGKDSTSAGKAACANAWEKVSNWPANRLSNRYMPVTEGGGAVATSRRPEVGSHSSQTEKNNCSRMPNQKAGSATSETAAKRVRWSGAVFFNTADIMPSGTPSPTPSSMDNTTSSSVAGKKRARSCVTGRVLTMDRPRSPCTTSVT